MDHSVLLDREEQLRAWPNKKDSDIATEIFDDYALLPANRGAEIEDTTLVHDEKVSTIIQRETDMQFLRRLAARNGFVCYVENGVGYFRSPQLDGPPQPVLAVHFGPEETNVERFTLEVNALTPAEVAMCQIDRLNKAVLSVGTAESRQRALGINDAAGLLAPGIAPGLVVAQAATTGTPELSALCQGLYHQAEWFVSGEGEVNANRYGHVLRPRRTVTIKGIGESYSGVYYVTHVTHRFGESGYSQHFRVKRNALMLDGSEDFAMTEGI